MTDSDDTPLPGDSPHPTRRELRRVTEAAEARGEGPLSQEETVRRAIAARADVARADSAGDAAGLDAAATAAASPGETDAADLDSAATVAASPGETDVAGLDNAATVAAHPHETLPHATESTEAKPTTGAEPTTETKPTTETELTTESAQVPVPVAAPAVAPASSHIAGTPGPPTAGIPIGHGFVTPPPRRYRRKQGEGQGDPKDYGKAGRNLPAAIGVGSVLGGSVLASLIFYPPSFVFIALVGVGLAMWELANALSRSGAHVSRVPVIAASLCMIIATYLGGREALWVAFTAGAGAVLLFALLERRTANAVKDVCLSLFALTYVGLTASLIVYLLTLTNGNLLVICFLALVVASDIGGYIAGVLFGKHPIAPKISPKKSWEGYAGSALMSTAVGVCMAIWAFDAPVWTGVVLGVLIPAFATLGDFSESMIKRDLDLKDMGSLLPGHGGIMDRLDSILPTAPVVLVLFSFLPGFVD